jgi:parallel beta-helix repeat protein
MTVVIQKSSLVAVIRRRAALITSIGLAGVLVTSLTLQLMGANKVLGAPTGPWPETPPSSLCSNSSLLSGPSTAPSGAVTVPDGDNSSVNFNQTNTVFWFEPGTHTLANDIYGQIIARDGSTYIGAPGAIIDGQNINRYAFTGAAEDVTVKYLTIQNFGSGLDNNNEGVVNHDSGTGWTIQYNTVKNNDGAGVFLGTDNVVSYNCLKDNGQYGFSMFKPPVEGDSAIKNIVLDNNEISGNNTDDWESRIEGCGCTGGGKFWDVQGATVTNNYVHDNRGTGLWADTNNIDFLFEGNYISDNDGEGIWYEISYNATIRNNTFSKNAWVSGTSNQGSPGPAVYISESGGDSRLPYTVSGSAQINIYDNYFADNFSGVSVYENANRFCNSNGNTSKGYCTPFVTPTLLPDTDRNYDYPNPIVADHPCYEDIDTAPYTADCRWRSQNVKVHDNEFYFDDTVVPCTGPYCGANALYATGADNMSWSPYTVSGVQNDILHNQGNSFYDNHYVGNWKFTHGSGGSGNTVNFATWTGSPFSQDSGSTIEGETLPVPTVNNNLDANSYSMESSLGEWDAWYSATTSQTTEQKHYGHHSLKVNVTDPWGWGVQMDNWPGVDVATNSNGVKYLSFWGRLGSGTDLNAQLEVKWLSDDTSGNNVLQTDTVTIPSLSSTWQNAKAVVDIPDGAVTALVRVKGTTGTTGDYLYIDDVVVGDAQNAFNAATAGAESSTGSWSDWYSATVASSTAAAHRGNAGLAVNVTDPYGWGVQLSNWPGFDTAAGDKRFSYWVKQGSGSITDATVRLKWFDGSNNLLQTDTYPVTSLTTSWQKISANVTAPAGTAKVYADIYSSSGTTGNSLYFDDFVLADR